MFVNSVSGSALSVSVAEQKPEQRTTRSGSKRAVSYTVFALAVAAPSACSLALALRSVLLLTLRRCSCCLECSWRSGGHGGRRTEGGGSTEEEGATTRSEHSVVWGERNGGRCS